MFGSQRPDRRKTVEVHHWIKLNAGDKLEVWIAGPGVGIHVHFQHGSKACRQKISNGELKCEFCKADLKPTYRCYFPLFDRAGTKRVTAINQDYDEQALLIPLHAAAVLWKKKIWGSPLVLIEDPKREPWVPRNDKQLEPIALQEWLLQVWHDPLLTAWVNKHKTFELPPCSFNATLAHANYAKEKELLENAGKTAAEEINRVKKLLKVTLKKNKAEDAKETEKNGKAHK